MFTGIIQTLGKVAQNRGGRLKVKGKISGVQPLGASIAVNGVCLTLVRRRAAALQFDLSPETLKLTNLGMLKKGALVNLEPSLRAGDLLGGHLVSGHCDTTARIVAVAKLQNGCSRLQVQLPKKLTPFVAVKGSIAVDGISLTVTRKGPSWFETVLVPHTLKRTTLQAKRVGDTVNLEVDVLARYVRENIKK